MSRDRTPLGFMETSTPRATPAESEIKIAVSASSKVAGKRLQDRVKGIYLGDIGLTEISLKGIAQKIYILHIKRPVQTIDNSDLFTFLLGGIFAGQHQHRVPCEPEKSGSR